MELEEMLSNGLIVTFKIDTNMLITTILPLIWNWLQVVFRKDQY